MTATVQPALDGSVPAPADDFESWLERVRPAFVTAAKSGREFASWHIKVAEKLPEPPNPKAMWGQHPRRQWRKDLARHPRCTDGACRMNPNWAIAAGLIVISGAIFIALHVSRAHQVIAVAIRHTDPPRIETKPGKDTDLLLDAYLVYHGPDALDRLLDAIDQTRKETP
jgi:hypothetical protein